MNLGAGSVGVSMIQSITAQNLCLVQVADSAVQ